MVRAVIINGQRYSIDQKNVLGVGGEATVVAVNGLAAKIYHHPDPKRIEKLHAFVKLSRSFPENVCAPQHLVFDSAGKKILGFAMRTIPQGHEVVQMLSSRKFRNAHTHINLQFICDVFMHDYQTTARLHASNVVIGDNNDLNKMFHTCKPFSVFIDVDSFQIGNYPCMVGTENYLDPSLYDINLADKAIFKPENDWYSFWAMFIKSLIMVHPYGGVHNQYRSIPQRALNRVTIFDQNVKYPKAALNLDLLSDNIKAITERIFAKGERFKPSLDDIREYREELVTCRSCGMQHPHDRSSCPQCATINTQQILRKTQIIQLPGNRVVHSQEIFSTTGSFVWSKLYGDKICAVAKEGDTYYLYRHSRTLNDKKKIFSSITANPKFDMFLGKYLVVSQDQLRENIQIIDTDTGKEIDIKPCGQFSGRRTFACTAENLIRLHRGFMYRGYIHPTLNTYLEDKVTAVMENQSWVACSPENSIIFLVERIFNDLSFSILDFDGKKINRHTMKTPTMEQNESILSMSIRFSSSYILLLMKTEIQGQTYTHVYVVKKDGTIVSNYKVESLPSETHKNIHGKAFAKPTGSNGIILHPTDDGIVQEIIGNNKIEKQSLMSETEQFVADGDSLSQYQKGILVIGAKQINYLTIDNKP